VARGSWLKASSRQRTPAPSPARLGPRRTGVDGLHCDVAGHAVGNVGFTAGSGLDRPEQSGIGTNRSSIVVFSDSFPTVGRSLEIQFSTSGHPLDKSSGAGPAASLALSPWGSSDWPRRDWLRGRACRAAIMGSRYCFGSVPQRPVRRSSRVFVPTISCYVVGSTVTVKLRPSSKRISRSNH
jgi:hypothetical protein